MKWFALIVLAIAVAVAVVSGLPFMRGHTGSEEASRFIDVKLAPASARRGLQAISWSIATHKE